MRTERKRPFTFTIEVERTEGGGWTATVDTDDAQERTFTASSKREAEVMAEAYVREWALEQPGTREAYAYDYSPPVVD